MTLKLKGDLGFPRMYLDTENEAASFRHTTLDVELKKYEDMSQGQNVKAPNYFETYRNRYSEIF